MQRGTSGRVATTAARMAHTADESFGIFQNIHVKPFPVRAAIDLGSGGVASLSIARVDAARGAVRDFMYQTQLPLHLQSAPSSGAGESFVLSDATRSDIRNKMRILHGAMRRDVFEGISERAAVLTWPLCDAADAVQFAEQLTREFKVDVRVLGKTFSVEMPSEAVDSSDAAETQKRANTAHAAKNSSDSSIIIDNNNNKQKNNSDNNKNNNSGSDNSGHVDDSDDSLRVLMRRIAQRRAARKHRNISSSTHDRNDARASFIVSPQDQMERLAFLAHAAAGQCVFPPRMLALAEDEQRGISILGTDNEPHDTDASNVCGENIKSATGGSRGANALISAPDSGVLRFALPLDASEALRILFSSVQRRTFEDAETRASPNPVLREEFLRLRAMLEDMIRPVLPSWVKEKSNAGGFICASSYNGGALNIAARIAQKTQLSLEHLETHAEMHYCGLTDVLLSANYPNPRFILPSAALTAALLRALDTRRVAYLPTVSPADALLLQPELWTFNKRASIKESLRTSAFYAGGSAARSFERPRLRENPTALPDAAWQRNQSWNPLSPDNSMRGT